MREFSPRPSRWMRGAGRVVVLVFGDLRPAGAAGVDAARASRFQ